MRKIRGTSTAHPYYSRFPKKCFLFDSGDGTFPVMPGIYASLTQDRYRPDHTRTGFYLYLIENTLINHRPLNGTEPCLASFFGSSENHPVRARLFAFRREDIAVRSTSSRESYRMQYHGKSLDRQRFWSDYADLMAASRFILCPRGKGAGSIRLCESMKMGAVRASSFRMPGSRMTTSTGTPSRSGFPRREVSRIPEILDKYADRAAEMGARARAESEQVRFHRVIESCLDICRVRGSFGWVQHYYHLRYIPAHLRRYFSSKKDLYRNNGRITGKKSEFMRDGFR